jgi:hypothetical protein
MPVVTRNQLRLGDILMTKYEGTGVHRIISFGSFLSGNLNTYDYVHAQIVCGEWPEPEIVESHAGGLQIVAPESPATVFRLRGTPDGNLTQNFAVNCAARAAAVAIELNGRQRPNDAFAQYAFGKAACSLATQTTTNQSVKTKLVAIEDGTSHDRLFCSMFVVVCYQVAIQRMVRAGQAPPERFLPFRVDAEAMEPAYMVSYLRRNPHCWDEVGDFPGGQD